MTIVDIVMISLFFGLTNYVTIKVGAYTIAEIRKKDVDKS